MAKEKGFYKDVGLDVKIKKYNKSLNITKEVTSKKATYAIGRSSLILDKSKNSQIVLLNALLKSSPLVLFSLKSSNIRDIQDLKNKKIMINKNETGTVALKAMLNSQNIYLNDMQVFKRTYNINDLINKKIDLMPGYISDKGFIFKEKKIDINIFNPKDYGFEFYEDILFTSQDELSENPKRVKSFNEASKKGWMYAFRNIEETVNVILEKYNSQNKSKEALLYEALSLKKMANLNKNGQLKDIDKNKIQRIYDIYNLLGLTSNPIKMNEFILENSLESIHLTQEEKEFLKTKKSLKACIDPNWMPFEKRINDEKIIGMSNEYFKIIKKHLKTPIEIVNTKNWKESITFTKTRECDFLSLLMKTKEREKFLSFTKPYIKTPLVMVTNIEELYIKDITKIENKRIAIVKNYAFKKYLQKKYPKMIFVDVKNIEEGLQKVKEKKLFALVDTLATAGFHIQKDFIGQLKIAGEFKQEVELSMGIRSDEKLLVSIFNKIINNITENQHQEILNKWLLVNYDHNKNMQVVLQWIIAISIVFSIILFIIIKANRKLNEEIRQRHIVEEELKSYINLVDKNVITSRTDIHGNITYASEAFCKVSGFTKDELIGMNHNIISSHKMPDEIYTQMWESIKKGKVWTGQMQNLNRNGEYFWLKTIIYPNYNKQNELIGYSSFREDITAQKKLKEISIKDELTNIYNRRHFNEIFPRLINRAKRERENISLAILDIDYFKQYNDTYGHVQGDVALRSLAQCLSNALHRVDDYCFRLGGEEFAILFKGLDKNKALLFTQSIRKSIEELNIIHEKNQASDYLTASFGLCTIYANDIEDLDKLYKQADDLLYKAKNSGKNTVISN